jgi:hypothetical protein
MCQNEGLSENPSGEQLPDQSPKKDMMRCIFRLLLLALAAFPTACSSLPKGPGDRPPEHQLFLQAVDETSSAAPGPALEALRRDYPDSPWTAKAQGFADLNRTRETLEIKIQTLQQDKNRLLQENRKLKEDLDKLKKLVIEMEKRRK